MLVTIIIPALLAAAVASAQEPTVILADHESVAPSTQELQFTVPDFSIEHQVRLSLLARIDFTVTAGSGAAIVATGIVIILIAIVTTFKDTQYTITAANIFA